MAVINKYVIMPNHIHLIIVIEPGSGDRGRAPLHSTIKVYIIDKLYTVK